VLVWFSPNARCVGVIPCWCGSAERPLCRVIACRGGARGLAATRNDGGQPAEPIVAADRCARKIVRFLTPLLRRARGG